jgi:hypothetical protein
LYRREESKGMAFVWNPYRQLIIRNAWWIVLLALDRNWRKAHRLITKPIWNYRAMQGGRRLRPALFYQSSRPAHPHPELSF